MELRVKEVNFAENPYDTQTHTTLSVSRSKEELGIEVRVRFFLGD